MIKFTIYVSRNILILLEDQAQLSSIRLISVVRNSDLDLTGVLIVTRDHFAQYIEGEPASLAIVMNSICRDSRHSDLTIWDPPQLARRRFPSWRMAFFEPDDRISQTAVPILTHLNGTLPDRQRSEMLNLVQNLSDQQASSLDL